MIFRVPDPGTVPMPLLIAISVEFATVQRSTAVWPRSIVAGSMVNWLMTARCVMRSEGSGAGLDATGAGGGGGGAGAFLPQPAAKTMVANASAGRRELNGLLFFMFTLRPRREIDSCPAL